MEEYYIFPGRFQPFHNDHLVVVRSTVAQTDGILLIGIVIHTLDLEDCSTFETEARLQNSPDRNPFSPLERLSMVKGCIEEELSEISNRILTILLPRPEANWRLIEAMFPSRRTWVVPDAGEEFDDMKAQFFASKGDVVMRIPITPSTNGYLVRNAILNGSTEWQRSVPVTIARQIENILARGTRNG